MSSSIVKKTNEFNPSPQPSWNQRILVVDDEKNIGEGIKALLMPEGQNVIPMRRSSRTQIVETVTEGHHPSTKFEVTVVQTPQAALEAVRLAVSEGKPYAMGFFDVLLNAEIDGIELVRQVFNIDVKMQAVFVTAYNDRSVDSISQFLGEQNASRWDYLNKPFTDGEILQKARNVISLWNLREQKLELDERLAEAQKWLLQNERANTVAAISRSFAHEFGNILMQIMGHCELAMMKNDPTRSKEALEVILRASETANSILGKFKNVSHPNMNSEGGAKEKSRQLINVGQILKDALELMTFQFKKAEVQIESLGFDQVLIEGNKHSLLQVFMNVLINATHSMPEGGKIEVSLQKLTEPAVMIKIRDHGTGIPADILGRVFEPMFSTKGDKGSGLGLGICKEIIEIEHQGELTIENHPLKGVVVSIKVPLRQDQE